MATSAPSDRLKARTETDQSPSKEKKYTEMDMLAAFRHGQEFKPYPSAYHMEIDPAVIPEHNRPFWDWLHIHDRKIIQPPPNRKAQKIRDTLGKEIDSIKVL
jgi:hypothetical protein